MKLLSLLVFVISLMSLPAQAQLDVHEWGTFTSLVGSNGETQNGMYHEDEPLPNFVHGFGETVLGDDSVTASKPPQPPPKPCGKACISAEMIQNNIITQKMETPVIYFYSPRAMNRVSVNVKFPDGVLTETYPGPTRTYPTRKDKSIVGNGDTTFTVDILDKTAKAALPPVNPGNIYGHARNVASNIVRWRNEQERFIFYRGLGRFQPRIHISSVNGNLHLNASAATSPKAAFLVHVAPNGTGQMLQVKGIGRGTEIKSTLLDELRNPNTRNPLIITGAGMRTALEGALTKNGLFADEAKAMIDTWENGYLKVPGLRMLYLVPTAEVDQLLPLTISPKPNTITRVFVARIEILLDTDEIAIMKQVVAQRLGFDVNTLGRFAEPMLRRVATVYSDYQRQNELPVDLAVQSDLQQLIARAAKGSNGSASAH